MPVRRRVVTAIDFEASPEQLATNLGHQGLYHDREVGMVFNRARSYHGGVGTFLVRGLAWVAATTGSDEGEATEETSEQTKLAPEALAELSEEELAELDIATVNLACAEGLPGAAVIDEETLTDKLDSWAERVRLETNKYHHRFVADPASFDNSVAQYRMIMLITVLMQDLGVRYHPERIHNVNFTRAEDLFLHGLLEGQGGTCVSLPVLYVAVGRRLGYRLRKMEWGDRPSPMFSARNIRYDLAERTRGLACGGIGAMHVLARRTGLIDALDRRLHLLKAPQAVPRVGSCAQHRLQHPVRWAAPGTPRAAA